MPGRLEEHLLALDRAWSGHHHDLVTPDLDAPDVDDRVHWPELAACELEGLCDLHDLVDSAEVGERLLVGVRVAADHSDQRPLLAARDLGLQADLVDAIDDGVDLGLGRLMRHDDDHGISGLRSESRSVLIAAAPRMYA